MKPRAIPLLIRKRRRRPLKAPPTLVAGPVMMSLLALGAVAAVWAVGILVVIVRQGLGSPPPRGLDLLELQNKNQYDELLDLWPDSRRDVTLWEGLPSCWPGDDDATRPCQIRSPPSTSESRVLGIIQTPGRLGQTMTSLVQQFLQSKKNADWTGRIITRGPHGPSAALVANQLLRVVILPPLLEAMDLALLTLAPGQEKAGVLPLDDVLGVLRQVMRWHCQWSAVAQDTALLTLFLDRLLAVPEQAQQTMTQFLHKKKPTAENEPHDDQQEMDFDLASISEQVMLRLDQCVAAWTRTLRQEKSRDVSQQVKAVLQQELARKECRSTRAGASEGEPGRIPLSRVTELVGHALDGAPDALPLACRKYPDAALCQIQERAVVAI